jgi:hypothetical protein
MNASPAERHPPRATRRRPTPPNARTRRRQVKYSEQAMKQVVASLFRERAHLDDVHEIDRLIKKGRMDLEEVLHVWQGDMHVNAFFDTYLEVTHKEKLSGSDFLTKFYANAD